MPSSKASPVAMATPDVPVAAPLPNASPVSDVPAEPSQPAERESIAVPKEKTAASVQEQLPLLIEDEAKFQSWLASSKHLDGLGFLSVIADMKSRRLTEDVCIQGTWQATVPVLKISMDICLGDASAQKTNTAELTLQEGGVTRQPQVFPSVGGMPSGFRLIQQDGQISVLIRTAQDVFQVFFFKKPESATAVWYQMDADLRMTRTSTFILNRS